MATVAWITFLGLIGCIFALPQSYDTYQPYQQPYDPYQQPYVAPYQPYQCPGQNTAYSSCTSCAPTCSNPYPDPNKCPGPCSSGCSCAPGYVLDGNGMCVKPGGCGNVGPSRPKCGPNEKYARCPSGCEPTCKNPHPKKCDYNVCENGYGCICRKGFIRNKYGDCIPRDLCPGTAKCGKNEKWNATECVPPTPCQEPHCLKAPSFCQSIHCKKGGCVCKENFLRSRKGKCVKPEQCYDDPCDNDKCDDDYPDEDYNPCKDPEYDGDDCGEDE